MNFTQIKTLAMAIVCLSRGCRQPPAVQATSQPPSPVKVPGMKAADYVGFDRNDYPGDDRLHALREHFAFTGYWLTPPPGETTDSWRGKRQLLMDTGFGFLVLANGRLDAEIKSAKVAPAVLGRRDAAAAIATAQSEGFPPHTVLFLDQEEGGRLLPEQSTYFFAWTEAVGNSAYQPGAYLSGQQAPDGLGKNGEPLLISTAQDIREHIAAAHLHEVALWIYQDACPPAPGCIAAPPGLQASGTPGASVWQYAQSPRRPDLTHSCSRTYATDNNCYAGVSNDLSLDLDVASTPDPSHGR